MQSGECTKLNEDCLSLLLSLCLLLPLFIAFNALCRDATKRQFDMVMA
jgi:hypothetical protein